MARAVNRCFSARDRAVASRFRAVARRRGRIAASQGALRPLQQLSPDQIQVREREGCVGARGVLGQTTVSDLIEAPESLHDQEAVLATSPHPRSAAVDLAPTLGNRSAGFA